MNGQPTTHAHDCPHCHAHGTVRGPDWRWKAALGVGWVVLFVEVAAISLIGPFILLMGPLVLFTGASLLGFLYSKANAPAECEACGKIATATAAEPQPLPSLVDTATAQAA